MTKRFILKPSKTYGNLWMAEHPSRFGTKSEITLCDVLYPQVDCKAKGVITLRVSTRPHKKAGERKFTLQDGGSIFEKGQYLGWLTSTTTYALELMGIQSGSTFWVHSTLSDN